MLPVLRSATLPGKANQGMNLKTFDDPFHLGTIIGKDVQTSKKLANWMPTLQQTCFKFNDSMTREAKWAKLTTSLVINSTRYLWKTSSNLWNNHRNRGTRWIRAWHLWHQHHWHTTWHVGGPCHPSSRNENYPAKVSHGTWKWHPGIEVSFLKTIIFGFHVKLGECNESCSKQLHHWNQQKDPENKPSQKEKIVFQPSIFRCFFLVSGN